MNQTELDELCGFLAPNTRFDVQSLALHHILSLTGTPDGRYMLIKSKNLINSVIQLAFMETKQRQLNKDAFFTLINMASDELIGLKLLEIDVNNNFLLNSLIDYVLNEESRYADVACAVLSNLSRGKTHAQLILKHMNEGSLDGLLKIFTLENFNKHGNNLDYLAPFLCNLTQLETVRKHLYANDYMNFRRLLPYTTYQRSIIRRGGIIGCLKNCIFDYDLHEIYLSSDLDLLSRLLLPLAGPEEFDDEDTGRLPEDLQYLPPDKEREEDPDIRIMLIESIMLFCGSKKCRDYVKDKNAYVILRELHKWEKDDKVIETCEKLVAILIADEPEQELENLHQVVIPESLSNKFYEYDTNDLEKKFE